MGRKSSLVDLLHEMLEPVTRKRVLKQIVQNEGVELESYLDSADPPVLTIGAGHTGHGVHESPITQNRVSELLAEDVNTAAQDVAVLVPTWKDLSQIRRAVLCEILFNLGRTKFAEFKNTLAAIAAGNHRLVASQLVDSEWSGGPPRGVGPRAWQLAAEYRLDRWIACDALN